MSIILLLKIPSPGLSCFFLFLWYSTTVLRHREKSLKVTVTHLTSLWVSSIIMVVTINPADWCELGLQLVGFDKSRQTCYRTNLERFVTHFGASPETHSLIFNDLQTTDIPEARAPNPDPLALLIATHWLKTYPKEAQIAGTFKVDKKTARKYVCKHKCFLYRSTSS